MADLMSVFIFLIAAAVLVCAVGLVVAVRKGAAKRRAFLALPTTQHPVRVVTKRTLVTGGGIPSVPAQTSYFVTFEFADGFRREIPLSGKAYGLLADNDSGLLTLRADHFVSFARSAPTRR